MQSIRRSRRNAMRVNAEINFTNLIDVAFVLLIIFMITAPIMQGGIEVQLPEAQAAPLQQAEALTVSIDADGQLFFEETPVTMAEIGDLVSSHMERRPQDYVALKVDARAAFEPFAQVLGIMAARNITNVSVPVMPQQAQPGRGR
jgi:biopolymer transport protein TolR